MQRNKVRDLERVLSDAVSEAMASAGDPLEATVAHLNGVLDQRSRKDACENENGRVTQIAAATLDTYVKIGQLRRLLQSDDVLLIRASYVQELHATGTPFPKRQALPPHAKVDAVMLERILGELESLEASTQKWEMHFPGLVIVSYAWCTGAHPDPSCEQMAELSCAIDWYMSERAKLLAGGGKAGGYAKTWATGRELSADNVDFGLFFDFCSMYQHERTEDNTAAFGRALKQMDLLYGHQLTVKWRLTKRVPSAGGS
jgi:hypothetical protein